MLCLGFLGWAEKSFADTHNAASCSQADVSGAISSSSPGDTVSVPAGECAWTTGITVNKSVSIIGAGEGQTIINDNVADAWASALFWMYPACPNNLRISGMTINRALNRTNESVGLYGNCSDWRVDHMTFNASWNDSTATTRFVAIKNTDGHPQGLLDHLTFNKLGITSVNPILVRGGSDLGWAEAMNFGGSDWVFVEDSNFNFPADTGSMSFQDGAIDCSNGGKYVFRHNMVNGTETGNHGNDSLTSSCLAMEIYDNTFTNLGVDPTQAVHLRGGTALIFNNTITGNYTYAIGLQNYRSCQYGYCGNGVMCQDDPRGWCDGNASSDGNTSPIEAYHGWPCKDQIGRGTNQDLHPLYQWNNTKNGVLVSDATVRNAEYQSGGICYSTTHIQAGRDYFNNIPMPDYTPYAYPHPLTVESDVTAPAAPSGLSVQ